MACINLIRGTQLWYDIDRQYFTVFDWKFSKSHSTISIKLENTKTENLIVVLISIIILKFGKIDNF